jgi:CHASE1-domain containing sensor protein
MIWNQIKAWVYAIVGSLFAVLGVASVYYRGQAKKQRRKADTLTATVHAERTRKKIEKEKKIELSRRESEIKRKGKDENFEGFDNLTDSNDWD